MNDVTSMGWNVVVLVGGVSGEHSISLRSAATVVAALEEAGHRTVPVGISPDGVWVLGDLRPLLERARHELVEVDSRLGTPVTLCNDGRGTRLLALDGVDPAAAREPVDVVFPVLHGPGGEDGTVQGFLELLGVPFVGAGCRASALAMDKLAMKALCDGAGIAQAEYLSAADHSAAAVAGLVESSFGFPCFVKPANLGSSVGISRVTDAAGLGAALDLARRWDPRVVVERSIDAREIEIALLGATTPEMSPPGEIVTDGNFYDFQSKYVEDGVRLVAGADVTAQQLTTLNETAARVWELIGCHGMARADFFIEATTGEVLFNEINTIPGFTEISMYPRLWKENGLSSAALVDRLVGLARERAGQGD